MNNRLMENPKIPVDSEDLGHKETHPTTRAAEVAEVAEASLGWTVEAHAKEVVDFLMTRLKILVRRLLRTISCLR